MKHSELENFDHKVLKKIISLLYKHLKNRNIENSEKYDCRDMFDDIEYVLRHIGLRDNYIDIDFVCTLYKLNYNLIDENGIINEAIIVPDLKNFTQEIDVYEKQWVRKRYEHEIDSYSIDTASEMLHIMDNNGDFDYWTGNLVDDEITESETDDVIWRDIYEN